MKTIDGLMLKEMFLSGAANINANRESVDALNVFPRAGWRYGNQYVPNHEFRRERPARPHVPQRVRSGRIARPRARCAARAAIRA